MQPTEPVCFLLQKKSTKCVDLISWEDKKNKEKKKKPKQKTQEKQQQQKKLDSHQISLQPTSQVQA